MFKLGDILVHNTLSCEVLVIAKEKGYYRTRHISGILDTGRLRIYDPKEWYIFGNIFEKKAVAKL